MLIPATSTEYLHVPVTLPDNVSPDATPVQVAIVSHRDNPAESEWRTAEWAGSVARILIGPGTGVTLTPGDYRVWIDLDPPGSEHVVRRAGLLSIT